MAWQLEISNIPLLWETAKMALKQQTKALALDSSYYFAGR